MSKKIEYAEAVDLLRNKHGNSIILLEYDAMKKPAKFQCAFDGTIWTACAGNIINIGTGCPICSRKRVCNKLRLSDEHVRQYIESKNCQWLDGNYTNIESKLLILFSCGHTQEKTFDLFKLNNKCSACGREIGVEKQKTSESEIILYVEKSDFKFVDFPNGYKNLRSLISYRCSEGHVTTRRWVIFKKNPRCKMCANNDRVKNSTNSVAKIQSLIWSKHAKWLSGEYIDDTSILEIEFECGHVMNIPYYAFRDRKSILCYDCALKIRGDLSRRQPEDFIKLVEEKGFVFCKFLEDYKGQSTKFEYICNKCNAINIKSVAYFVNNQYCSICYKEVVRLQHFGSNSVCWKGGHRRLSLFFRNFISGWYLESLKINDYKCVISGKPAKAVHHSYSFHRIVDNYLLDKGISSKMELNNFSSEELNRMADEFTIYHNSFGLGIPLTKKIHQLFHKIYWTTNNTPSQFEEFKQRLSSGDIKLPE